MITKEEILAKAGTIDGWMGYDELEWLYDTAINMNNVVEIGSYRGRSSFALAHAAKIRLICVDPWDGSVYYSENKDYNEFLKNTKSIFEKITVIRDKSFNAAEKFNNESLDMAFIDGDHNYDHVCIDINKWLPKLRKGGIISGHDANHPPVWKAVKELLGEDVKLGPGAIWYKHL